MTTVPWPKSASTTSARTLATVSFVAAEPSASPSSTRASATARSACKETPRLHAQRWDARRTMIVHPGKSATTCQPTVAGKSVSLSVCQATATPMLAARQRTTKKFALASLLIRETVMFHALKVINQAFFYQIIKTQTKDTEKFPNSRIKLFQNFQHLYLWTQK